MIQFSKTFRDPRLLALADQCVISFTSFFSVLVLGRHLKVDDFGYFSLALLTVIFLANLHRAFATQPLNVLGAEEDARGIGTRMSVMLCAHALMLPAAIAIFACVAAAFYPSPQIAVAGAVFLAVSLLQETTRRYWYTIERLDRALVSDALSGGLQCVSLLAATRFRAFDAATAFYLMACSAGLALAVGLKGIDRLHWPRTEEIRSVVREHWKMSRWLVLTVLALWASSQLYPFLIVKLGPVVVASFAVCRNLLSAMHVVVQAVTNYLPSRAALLLKRDGGRAFRRHAIRTSLQAALLSVLCILAMQVAALPVLHFLYRGHYDSAEPLLRTLAICMLPSLLGAVVGSYSLAMHDSRSTFFANFASAVFTFTGGLWLINAFGAIGAMTAVSLSLTVATLLQGGFLMIGIGRLSDGSIRATSPDALGDL